MADGLLVNLSGAYTDADEVTGENRERAVRVPRVQAVLSFAYQASARFSLALGMRRVRGVLDIGAVELDDYTLINMRGRYKLTDATEIYARIENTTDETYETVKNYATPGRAGYVGVAMRF